MPRVLGKLFIFIFFLVSGFFWLPLAHAEGGFFGTESIRSQLFGRMDDKKEKKTLRTVSENIVEGVFSRMTDSESVWVRIDNRNEFRKWTFKLSKMNLNLPRQEIRVWLKYVSPKLSISHGKKYNDWFRKKAAFETQKIFYNRSLRINYDYSESLYRLDGMLWTGDTNINVWIIRKGWSYYLLQEEPPPGHNDFLAAEKEAQKLKIGLWKPELQ